MALRKKAPEPSTRRDPDVDAATYKVATAICAEVYPHIGCFCASVQAGPCRAMTMAACAAERAIEARKVSA